jgi:hypothetical protein
MEELRSVILRTIIFIAAIACYAGYSGNKAEDKSTIIEMNETASDATASLVFEIDSFNDEHVSSALDVPYNAAVSDIFFDTRDVTLASTFPFSLWLPPKA